MHPRNRSGQILLVAVLIGLLLVICIPIIVYLNQTGVLHQVASQKRMRGRDIAEEGISYATVQLSSSTAQWQSALQGKFKIIDGAPFDTDCNTGNFVRSPSGAGQFKLSCSTGTDPSHSDLQPYQVSVVAVAYLPDSNSAQTPQRAVQAYLSQRALGADLSNGFHAAAALQLVSTPTALGGAVPPANSLTVHWGPIVVLDTNTWTLANPLDQVTVAATNVQGYPRKISLGGITGPNYLRSPNSSSALTDQKEYWAFASFTYPPSIDENYYMFQSSYTTVIPTPPASLPSNGSVRDCPAINLNCGYFRSAVLTDTITFNGTPYAVTGSTIYVEGNAQFDNIDMDNVSIVVTGNLILGNPAGGSPKNLHVPNTADLEYYYWDKTAGQTWPCSAQAGQPGSSAACRSDNISPQQSPFTSSGGKVHVRGFLYVRGNLFVNSPNWNLVGSVLVGNMALVGTPNPTGQLIFNPGGTLTLAYDDGINRNIHVYPAAGTALKVVADVLKDIPALPLSEQ